MVKKARKAPRTVEPLPGEDETIVVLLRGSDEDRQGVLAGLRDLPARRQSALRVNLKSTIEWSRERQYTGDFTGWLVSALAQVAGSDREAIEMVVEHLDRKRADSEWVRYWALANLFWIRGSKEAAERAIEKGAIKDPSLLVRELADAIVRSARGEGPIAEPLSARAENTFGRLRALQVVAPTPALVSALVEFLLSAPNETLTYETLRALTADAGTAKLAAARLASASAADLVELVVNGSRGADARLVARFAHLFEEFPREETERLLRDALKTSRVFVRGIAKTLLDTFTTRAPSSLPPALPPGAWRAELAYRSVLQRPDAFDVLESLSAAPLSSVLQQSGLTLTDTAPDKLAALARSIAPGGPPNALWLAWIKNVHAGRLTQD